MPKHPTPSLPEKEKSPSSCQRNMFPKESLTFPLKQSIYRLALNTKKISRNAISSLSISEGTNIGSDSRPTFWTPNYNYVN